MEPEDSVYCIHKRPAHITILSLISLFRCPRTNLLKFHFNIILPLTPRFSKWALSLRFFYNDLCMHPSFLPYLSHNSPISFSLTWSPGYYVVSLVSPTTRLIEKVNAVSLWKKSSKVSYNILLLSDCTSFKLFFHIFAAIIEAFIVAGHKFLYTLLIECSRLQC